MTDREKAIVMAYTGVCMLTGDKFQIFHKYIEDIMGRPIMTHEIGWLENEIKEKSKADFIKLCADEEQELKTGHWTRELIRNEKGGCIRAKMICSKCGQDNGYDKFMKFCPNCGARMVESKEEE